MSFNSFNLDPRLLKNVQAMDFEEPTPIQSATIPAAWKGVTSSARPKPARAKRQPFCCPCCKNSSIRRSCVNLAR